jgi:hypothetical protein
VVEFAYTHHGTQVVEYFWHKCKEAGNPKGLTQEHFRYPGMKPQTKETAILMLVDSIEAASRTIFPPELKKFEEMIQRVVFTKLSGGQLDESGLALEDLRIITARTASTLVNMYHGRIKYPWQREADRDASTAAKLALRGDRATAPTPAPADVASATPPVIASDPAPPQAASAEQVAPTAGAPAVESETQAAANPQRPQSTSVGT